MRAGMREGRQTMTNGVRMRKLTKRQRALLYEGKAIARGTLVDLNDCVEMSDVTSRLWGAIHRMVTAEILMGYTMLDEMLACLICKHFFKSKDFPKLWRTKRFRTFNHYVLDDMYLLKKLDFVHAVKPLPSWVQKSVRKVNGVRNAFAHSFFPENRKEYRKTKKVLYNDKDIRTWDGLRLFRQDWRNAQAYLDRRLFYS
jgi:hypothetical protein